MNSIIEKKCKVVMLPTEKATGLFIETMDLEGNIIFSKERELEFTTNETLIRNNHLISNRKANTNIQNKYEFQHLYILSDDEIQIGDWTIDLDCKESHKRLTSIDNQIELDSYVNGTNYYNIKKIIATTDTSLKIISRTIEHNSKLTNIVKTNVMSSLPQLSQQFINKFIEKYNESIIIDNVIVWYEQYWEKIKGEYPKEPQFKPKTDKNNTITIKRLKDSWNREEVELLINALYSDLTTESTYNGVYIDKWISNNLN